MLRGRGSSWTPTPIPYRGRVLAIALDGTQPYLLYANRDGVYIARREDDQFTNVRTVSEPPSGEWAVGRGDLIANNGKWWAVWAEQLPPRGYGLFQASTMTSGDELPRQPIPIITTGIEHTRAFVRPTLTLDPGNPDRAAMAWTIVAAEKAVLRFGRALVADAQWREQRVWAPKPGVGGVKLDGPNLLVADGNLHGVYASDGRIIHTLNPPTDTVTDRFRTAGVFPRVAHSAGRTLVAWTASEKPAHVIVGERTPSGVLGELDLTPGSGDQQLLGIVEAPGHLPTVLGVGFPNRHLWARTQRRPTP